MQFVDVTFGEREEADVGVPQSLVDGGDILLIAAEAIEGLGHHTVEPGQTWRRSTVP